MKKTCSKCKALSVVNGCQLGYKTDYKMFGHAKFYYPKEECPKPLTYEDFISWYEVRQNY